MSVLILILLRIAPIFLILMTGYAAFRLHWVDAAFTSSANRLVYRVALPALIFLSISEARFTGGIPWREIVAFGTGMLLTLWAGFLAARLLGLERPRRASFLQGAIRGNFAIIGLAIIERVLGPEWLPFGAVLLAFFLPLHNFAGISVLSILKVDENESVLRRLSAILRRSLVNPLMIAIYLGVAASLMRVALPVVLLDTLNYLRRLTLPLALIGIGGSIGTFHAGGHYKNALWSAGLKLILMPFVTAGIGLLLGLRGEVLLILVIFSGAPTAIASYSMADFMGADRDTAGSIVLVTTGLCFLSLTLILTLLQLNAV